MASWATAECRCGHPRFRHGEPRFSGACEGCLCGAFEMAPPPFADPDLDPAPAPARPEPDRTPHPSRPFRDPDRLGVHDPGA
ncbi:hypothetical protein [Streptomyces sp. NPDC051180]|uniref:hypothetical protein n=1 Tax=unclassified Streptomyces TaxID=2593676 RepID=UPI003450439C